MTFIPVKAVVRQSEVMEKHASHEVNAGHFDVIPVKP